MSPDSYLIWSNQHGMWWRPRRSGYTQIIEEAGRYAAEEARLIVALATCNWQLERERTDPVTGEAYVSYDEVAVPAPQPVGPPGDDDPERLREKASELLTAANQAEAQQ
jgi:hypothetical protein